MPVTVRRLPNEPVIIAELSGYVKAEETKFIFTESQRLRADMPEYIYRITDASQVDSTFAELMGMIKVGASQGESSTTDPTVHVVFVGRSQWIRLFVDAMRQQQNGGVMIPIFATQAEALEYVRTKINEEAS